MRVPSLAVLVALLCAGGLAALEPPRDPIDFNLSAGQVQSICQTAKSRADESLQALALQSTATFRTTFVPFSDILSDLADETAGPMFLGHVAVDKAVRDAGLQCDTDISKYVVGVFAREDLYRPLLAAADRGELVTGEDARLVEKTLADFKRSGLDLPPAGREKLKAMRQKLVELSNDFAKEVAETKDYAFFTPAQMAGVPEDMLKRLPREGGGYRVSLDYPDYFPFMENARDPAARRVLQTKFDSRGGEANKKRLAEILRLRDEAARLLGYRNHAEYVLEDRMASSPEEVSRFLAGLREKLYRKGRPELRELIALKKAEEGRRSDGMLDAWDWRYYHNQLMKQRYQVDKQKIREYFPTDLVVDQMLKIYQEVLGLRFTETAPAAAWHPDVKQFEIADARTGVKIGRFFMDLYPREGKYKHAAAFSLIQGRQLPDGSYQRPASAIVANFDKPTPQRPSLLPHSDVETLFHEFGHIMHQTLTRAKYQRFSGSSVARDFVEAPSQMFQNWVWKKAVLDRVSGHYQDRAKKLPPEMIAKLLAAKQADSGLVYLRQNFIASYDMDLHTAATPPDSTALYGKLMREITLIPMTPGTMPEAGFTHITDGYDAGYYGYLWSEVYALDAFARFVDEGLLSPKVGREFRRAVLEPGGSRDEAESLRAFLGRAPNDEAFLRNIGLDLKPAAAR